MMIKRLCMITIIFGTAVSVICMHIFSIVTGNEYKETALKQGKYTLTAGSVNANIYDCNMNPIVNTKTEYLCAVNPTSDAIKEILPHVKDSDSFYSKIKHGKPFICTTDTDSFESENITVFTVPERYSSNQPAQHIIGYTADGEGVCGLEMSYNTFLRSFRYENSVTYNVDGIGNVLEGINRNIIYSEEMKAGIITTLDLDIQKICEETFPDTEKGTIIVMDIKTGDIKAMASFPSYSTEKLETAVNDEDLPLLNRALCSYNAGSVFKLMICQCALESGISDNFTYNCTGSTDVNGQIFRCHKEDGHGYIDMESAVTNSCNTYFIELSKKISSEKLIETAEKMGFGNEIRLADNLYTSAGNLPELKDLDIPAEKANFSFGQGKLLVNPIQITRMICAAANNGHIPSVQLIKGITYDGKTIENQTNTTYTDVMSTETAEMIQKFMTSAIYNNQNANAYTEKVSISAKTSTAQTGIYDNNGYELCHAWSSGYFPSENPQYAVTVMVENGGYGNETASPILKDIAEKITEMNKICESDES